ncbi:hypothetical protein C1X35_20375 [Pseudomonas sp. FW306-1C-G01A]|nr:hypothetical protein C1X56_05230 [Pseudomonas sp. GW101-1A09]PMV92323.1 hypothetical protein C1X51_18450 [Pseudomonas sp. FW306-2-2C-B10A]PMV93911.1 hypothetical protein C1X55_25705 [Pseudomonas sp. GW460-C8]PMW08013.1 hypothetical protein C1X50_02810 [Pseudomonas sp. MPR-TSA4]PMW14951.1 hypothetical protein C1X40_21400 [Pseudomonas sp. GW456-11-11-14-TSB2]PMW20341.1 hypothetical protein C1X52_05490 [Pseudomonas sp. FW306-2-1A-C05A]PMW26953.1 hypothetical protein C1X53_01095 [Pseudomonas s
MGASLLAKAVGQSTSMAADRLHSRAASLPQVFFVVGICAQTSSRPSPSRRRSSRGHRANFAR